MRARRSVPHSPPTACFASCAPAAAPQVREPGVHDGPGAQPFRVRHGPSTVDEGGQGWQRRRGLGSPVRARRGHAGFITCGGHHAIRAKSGSEDGLGREPLGPRVPPAPGAAAGLRGRGVAVLSRPLRLRGPGASTLTLSGTPGREDTWGRAPGPSCDPGFLGFFFLFDFAALLAAVRCYGNSGWLPGDTLLSGVLHRHECLYRVHLKPASLTPAWSPPTPNTLSEWFCSQGRFGSERLTRDSSTSGWPWRSGFVCFVLVPQVRPGGGLLGPLLANAVLELQRRGAQAWLEDTDLELASTF